MFDFVYWLDFYFLIPESKKGKQKKRSFLNKTTLFLVIR